MQADKTPSQRSQVPQSNRSVPSSTRRFANNYAAFYNVQNLNEDNYNQAKAMKQNLGGQKLDLGSKNPRLNTGIVEDPNFKANKARFYGAPPKETEEFYKAQRAFYASTPLVRHATHMGQHA